MSRFRKLSQTVWHCQYHIVWTPKYRGYNKVWPCGSGFLLMTQRILILTKMYPNSYEPNKNAFVRQEIDAFSKYADIDVIAPVPYFPRMPLFGFLKRYNILSKIEKAAQYGLINVYYPRFITPKVLYSFYSLWYYIGIIPTVKKLVNRKKYDYIIAFWAFPDGVAAVKIGQRFGLPVFVKVLGCDINQLPKRKDLRKQIRKSLSIANGIIAVSHPLKENVVALGITEDNILVAENGIDDTVFHLRETSAISKKLGYPEKQKTILYIGRFSEEKNPMLLLEAVHLLKEGGCRFRVVICGWGEMQHQMLQYTKDNELEDIVYFLGELKHHQVAEHMSCADVLCLSSRREGYPNVLIEAISCGLPVVATRVGGVPTIVVEGRNGLTVEPENPEDMANKLKQALSHEWNRQVVKETLQVPTWKEVAEKTMEWIQQRI